MNHLKREIQGHFVLLKSGLVALCLEGDGCLMKKLGETILGEIPQTFERLHFSSDEIDRFATQEEIAEAFFEKTTMAEKVGKDYLEWSGGIPPSCEDDVDGYIAFSSIFEDDEITKRILMKAVEEA